MSEAEELADRLRYYNDWRRGADTEMPEPKQIGADIDRATELLEHIAEHKELEEAYATIDELRKICNGQTKVIAGLTD